MRWLLLTTSLAIMLAITACGRYNDTVSSAENTTKTKYNNCIYEFKAEYDGDNDILGGIPTNINKNAVIYEIDWENAKELLDSKETIYMLFSASWCPYCKVVNGPLTDALVQTKTPIYYVDIEQYPRTQWGVVENEDGVLLPVQTEIHADYEEFLKEFTERTKELELPTKILYIDDEIELDTGAQYIGVPAVIRIDNSSKQTIETAPMKSDLFDITDGLQQHEVSPMIDHFAEFFTHSQK